MSGLLIISAGGVWSQSQKAWLSVLYEYLVSSSAQSHHLVQVSLEISLLHVNLLIGLNDIFQLLLSLLTLLKLDNTHKLSENF